MISYKVRVHSTVTGREFSSSKGRGGGFIGVSLTQNGSGSTFRAAHAIRMRGVCVRVVRVYPVRVRRVLSLSLAFALPYLPDGLSPARPLSRRFTCCLRPPSF
jgi:hypothetical protein